MLRKRRGLTLIEMVSIIVVLGLAIPILLTMWADVAWRSSRSEVVADAIFYTQQLMEEIKSKGFDSNSSSPWTNAINIGVDSGEDRADKDTFDDVDDFVTLCLPGYSNHPTCDKTCTDTRVTVPANLYSRSVRVEYVYLDASRNWQPCATPVICIAKTNCANCNQCCYKRIIVSVSRTDNLVKDVNLTSIVSGFK